MKPTYVYFIREPDTGNDKIHVKIGISQTPWGRLKEISMGHPHKLILDRGIKAHSSKQARALEYYFHAIFKPYHTSNEWFRLGQMIHDLMYKHLHHYGEVVIFEKGQIYERRKGRSKSKKE